MTAQPVRTAAVADVKALIADEKWEQAEALVREFRLWPDEYCPAPDAHADQVAYYGECQWCYLSTGGE